MSTNAPTKDDITQRMMDCDPSIKDYLVKNGVGEFLDELLDACVHRHVGDPENLWDRAIYLFGLLDAAGIASVARPLILHEVRMVHTEDDSRLILSMIALFAHGGDIESKQLLWSEFKKPREQGGCWGSFAIVRNEGLHGLIEMAKVLGADIPEGCEDLPRRWYQMICAMGEDESFVQEFLQAAAEEDEKIQQFVDYLANDKAEVRAAA